MTKLHPPRWGLLALCRTGTLYFDGEGMQLAQFAGDSTGITYISGVSNKVTVDLTGGGTVVVDASSSSELPPSSCQTSCVSSNQHVTSEKSSPMISLSPSFLAVCCSRLESYIHPVQRLWYSTRMAKACSDTDAWQCCSFASCTATSAAFLPERLVCSAASLQITGAVAGLGKVCSAAPQYCQY